MWRKRVSISGSVRKLHATSSCVSLRFEGRAEEQPLVSTSTQPNVADGCSGCSFEGCFWSLLWWFYTLSKMVPAFITRCRILALNRRSQRRRQTFSTISCPVSLGLSVNLKSRWWKRETSHSGPSRSSRSSSSSASISSTDIPVDQYKCLLGHICLLTQVAAGEG